MDYQKFLHLHQDYSASTSFLSYIKNRHPSYQELLQAGPQIVPWLLQRLQETIGHDTGKAYDHTNSPWLSISLLSQLIPEALTDMPEEYAGYLDKVRQFILERGARYVHPTVDETSEPIVGVPIIIVD